MTGPGISVSLCGALGDFRLDASFAMPLSGVTGLFGPSGCGKTSILRCLAGLEHVPGRISIGDDVWQESSRGIFLPTHRRQVGYVFQEASLFAHLSVRDNLLYGARRRAVRATGAAGFEQIVALLGLQQLLDRAPDRLSGGERQRVAIGRALLAAPKVLLMDEPLSALDRPAREEILPYLERLHEDFPLPILYVSHELTEIERLADHLVLLAEGKTMASGAMTDLQNDPKLPFLRANDPAFIVEGQVASIDENFGLTCLSVKGGALHVTGRHGSVGDFRRLRISASDVSLARTAPHDSTILNCLPARIKFILGEAPSAQVTVVLGLGADGSGAELAARISRKSMSALALAPGDQLIAQIKGVALLASRTGTGR